MASKPEMLSRSTPNKTSLVVDEAAVPMLTERLKEVGVKMLFEGVSDLARPTLCQPRDGRIIDPQEVQTGFAKAHPHSAKVEVRT